VTQEDRHTTAEHERSEARGAELREELAITDARRAEEEVAKQHKAVEAAQREEEKLSRKQRRAAERAEQAAAEAERARREAAVAAPEPTPPAAPGATGAAPEPDAPASPLERPEVQLGAAFAGAFLAARILKRFFD
jgi:translation initiation factor IF-2